MLIEDEQRAAAALAVGQQFEADLTLVTLRAGQRERPRRAVGGGHKVQVHTPEVARVGGAPAVVGEIGERRRLK